MESNSIQNITVYINYHGENPAESVNFNINLTENGYVADRINAEELTGLTIEEMVETAELNRKGFEDLMLLHGFPFPDGIRLLFL